VKIKVLIISIVLFIIVSVAVLNSKDTSSIKPVVLQNQNIVLEQKSTKIVQESTKLKPKEIKFENKTVSTSARKVNLTRQETSTYKIYDFHKKEPQKSYNTETQNYSKLKSKNSEDSKHQIMTDYLYEEIDWSIWRSNFINKILDDSFYIKSLDKYDTGNWFYYSFYVTDKGEITDVNVFSLYLTKEDIKEIEDLIYSYAHSYITVFPKNSKRERVKVKAIVMLDSSEKRAAPSDINDSERIRVPY